LFLASLPQSGPKFPQTLIGQGLEPDGAFETDSAYSCGEPEEIKKISVKGETVHNDSCRLVPKVPAQIRRKKGGKVLKLLFEGLPFQQVHVVPVNQEF
jgi:hypothetical protein